MRILQHQSRRQFLKAACLGMVGLSLPELLPARSKAAAGGLFYIGTYTSGKSEGIYLYRLEATGALSAVGATKVTGNPSYLALDQSRKHLYAVNEITDYEGKTSGAVSAFAIDPKTGGLQLLNQQATMGGAPCYVSLDESGKYVLVANYVGGNISVFPVESDGSLKPSTDMVQHQGSGPNNKRQEGPHAHCVVAGPGGRHVFAVDLGTDKVMIYRLDPTNGKLSPNSAQPFVQTKPGAGPRHITFHPNAKYAFLINELNSTLTSYAYDSEQGTLKEIQTLSTLPTNFSGESFCADIHVSSNGKFIYGSNRGHNSIVVMAVDERSGKLSLVEHVPTGGKWPRNFAIDPSGKFMLVANQHSSNVVSFRINAQTGKLTPTGKTAEIPDPVCVKFA